MPKTVAATRNSPRLWSPATLWSGAFRVAAAAAAAGCLWSCGDEPAGGAGKAVPGSPQAAVAEGKRLFSKNGCQVCHGDQGRGDGRMASALRPPPRDFRDVAGYRRGASAPEIARTIGEGISTGRGGMPAYSHLTPEERQAIARFVVALQEP